VGNPPLPTAPVWLLPEICNRHGHRHPRRLLQTPAPATASYSRPVEGHHRETLPELSSAGRHRNVLRPRRTHVGAAGALSPRRAGVLAAAPSPHLLFFSRRGLRQTSRQSSRLPTSPSSWRRTATQFVSP
jgi:hypothetical protein